MMKLSATYVREGDQIFAFHKDLLIAHGTRFAEVEKTAVEYLDGLSAQEDADIEAKKVSAAKYVETPNGLKGEILGNVKGQWGDREITVRWENGRIAKYETHGEGFQYIATEPEKPQSALEYLEGTLNASYDHDKESLSSRVKDLDGIVAKVAQVVGTGVSAADARKLDKIALEAEHEKHEVREALDHLENSDQEAFAPPAPFDYGVAEQADLGPSTQNNWLDETVEDMIAEAEGQDFDKLLDEGPGQFVTDLDTGALADQGVTQEMALSHITSKTAGLVGADVENFRKAFCAKIEQARRAELADRSKKSAEQAQKTASQEENAEEASDESLFL